MVSMGLSVKQGEETSTHIFLNLDVGLQESGTSQGYSTFQQNRSGTFEDFNRHGLVHVRSPKIRSRPGI